MDANTSLTKLVELEFNYIKETAHQAISDRYTMLQFYIGVCTAVGTVVIGLFSLGGDGDVRLLKIGAMLLALFTGVIGWIFLAIMIRLREAWHESISALNHLKYETVGQDLVKVFMWNTKSIPDRARLWNIHFYATILIILLNSLFFSLGLGLLASAWDMTGLTVSVVVISYLISVTTQLTIYLRVLK